MNANAATEIPTAVNYDAIKAKQQIAWGSGDYARVGVTLQITGESLCEAMDMRSGESVLDVAAGNGNATLAAARRFCKVISTDYVQTLLDHSKSRAAAEGLSVEYQIADAESLPFEENTFSNVVSTFGVMFSPNQTQASNELMRVCRPGGKIGLACWTPDGFIGQIFKILGGFITPPAGLKSPALWGTEDFVQSNFGDAAHVINNTSKDFVFRYHSPEHWLDIFGTYYGPLVKAFEALDQEKSELLKKEILKLIDSVNIANDGTMVVPSRYLETIVRM